MRWRWVLGVWAALTGDILIDLPVEGHDAAHRTHRNIRSRSQTPEAKLPSIRMPLLQVVDVDHQREPDLARWHLRRAAFVLEPGKMFGSKAVKPPVNGGP